MLVQIPNNNFEKAGENLECDNKIRDIKLEKVKDDEKISKTFKSFFVIVKSIEHRASKIVKYF